MSVTIAKPLWEIEAEMLALLDSVDTCPDEFQHELQTKIAAYIDLGVQKVDQVAHVLSCLEYEERAAADEMERLAERKRHAKAARERLESYVCRVIDARGVKKLEGKTNTLSVRPSDAVVIRDESSVPSHFKYATVKMPLPLWGAVFGVLCSSAPNSILRSLDSVKPTVSVSAAEIKVALKAGESVSGADLEFRKNLQRK